MTISWIMWAAIWCHKLLFSQGSGRGSGSAGTGLTVLFNMMARHIFVAKGNKLSDTKRPLWGEKRTLAGAKYLGSKCVLLRIIHTFAWLSEVAFETATMASNQFVVNAIFWGDMRRVNRLNLFEELEQADEHDTKENNDDGARANCAGGHFNRVTRLE